LPTAFFNGNKAVSFQYLEGDSNAKSTITSSLIYLICDPSQTISFPAVIDAQSDGSVLELTWNSIYACPVCNETVDYAIEVNECNNGFRDRVYVRKGSCNGPTILSRERETCPISYNSVYIAFASLSVVGLVCIGFVLALVCYRNRTLQHKYDMLFSEQSKTYELSAKDLTDNKAVGDEDSEGASSKK